MNALKIRFELAKKGMRYVDVAEKCEMSGISVGAVIYRKFRSEKIMKCIAEIIGQPVEKVFPEFNEKSNKKRNPYKMAANN